MHAGETITLTVQATDPLDDHVINDAVATAYLFAPPKNPRDNPGDRTPDHTVALAFDAEANRYAGTQDTTGFAPGTWWVQGKVEGGAKDYNGWDYYSFPLDA